MSAVNTALRLVENPNLSVIPIEVDEYNVVMLWDDARDQWLKAKRARSKGENTVIAYRAAHKHFFKYARVRPWLVRAGIVQRWANWMREEGGREGKGLAESTVNQRLAAMSDFYEFVTYRYQFTMQDSELLQAYVAAGLLFAVEGDVSLWSYQRANPFNPKVVERTKISPFERSVYPTTLELKTILGAINRRSLQGKRDYALLLTYAVTCRRSSEILNLRWGDIRALGDGNYAFRYRYKGGSMRDAVLSEACYEAIGDYLDATDRLDDIQADDYIFTPLQPELMTRLGLTYEPNKPISNTLVNRILKKYARRTGIDASKAHVHGLRHAGARLRVEQMAALGKKVDYVEVMNLLGHSSLAVTQIYVAKVLTNPEDRGADGAAMALMPRWHRRRRAAASSEQGQLV